MPSAASTDCSVQRALPAIADSVARPVGRRGRLARCLCVLAALAGCAPPQYIPLKPEQASTITSTRVHATIVQEELDAAVKVLNTQNGSGGLLGAPVSAVIDTAVTSHRAGKAADLLEPIRKEVSDSTPSRASPPWPRANCSAPRTRCFTRSTNAPTVRTPGSPRAASRRGLLTRLVRGRRGIRLQVWHRTSALTWSASIDPVPDTAGIALAPSGEAVALVASTARGPITLRSMTPTTAP
jgi:hypothetical protein